MRDGCAPGRAARVEAFGTRLDARGRAHVRYRVERLLGNGRSGVRLETSAGGRVVSHTPPQGDAEGEIELELPPASGGRYLRFVVETRLASATDGVIELGQSDELRFEPAPEPRLPARVVRGGRATIPVPCVKGGAR